MLSPEMRLGQRYRLLERIAVGGMGEVWRAEDTVLERKVAVKALLPALLNEPGFAKRFAAEAKTVAALSHPHIVSVHDYGQAPLPSGDTTTYLVMEYIEGRSLSDLIAERGALSAAEMMPIIAAVAAEMMPIIAAVAEALQHAHDHGVIHRDIKPGNILVRARDGQAVLTDFGIARSGAAGDLTATGAVMGTASYIAPEQAEGTGVLPASDMYSLGVVAFHGLTGRRPFDAENPIELALHHVRTPAPPLPEDIEPGVRAFVERSMTKDPSQRFATCADMASAARAALTAPPATSVLPNVGPAMPAGAGVVGMGGPPAGVAGPHGQVDLGPPAPQAPKTGRNKALLGAIVAIVALVLVGGMVWLALMNGAGGEDGDGITPAGEDTSEVAESSTPESDAPEEDPSDDDEPEQTPSEELTTGRSEGGLGDCIPGTTCDQ